MMWPFRSKKQKLRAAPVGGHLHYGVPARHIPHTSPTPTQKTSEEDDGPSLLTGIVAAELIGNALGSTENAAVSLDSPPDPPAADFGGFGGGESGGAGASGSWDPEPTPAPDSTFDSSSSTPDSSSGSDFSSNSDSGSSSDF